jgi:hypothetical protein
VKEQDEKKREKKLKQKQKTQENSIPCIQLMIEIKNQHLEFLSMD